MTASRNSGRLGQNLTRIRGQKPVSLVSNKEEKLIFLQGAPTSPRTGSNAEAIFSVRRIWKMIGKKRIGVEDVVTQKLPYAAMNVITA